MAVIRLSNIDAESFLSDAIYLEHLVSTFSSLENTDDLFFARLNRDVGDPENLQLLREAVGNYGFRVWVDKLSLSGDLSAEFQQLSDTVLGRKSKIHKNNQDQKYQLSFGPAAKEVIEVENKTPHSPLKKAIDKALATLANDPHYIGLRTHRDPKLKVFISYITNRGTAYRLIWVFGDDDRTIKVLAIIPHDDYGHLSAIL
jgi:hypothetical protein